MPNGDPNWGVKEFPKLEMFFSKISDILEFFADTHNLMIDKYYHQGPDWTFRFRHPEGGVCSLFVIKEGEDYVKVAVAWHMDDYDKLVRYTKHAEPKKYSLEKPILLAALNEMLNLVLSWHKEDLTPVKHKYHEWKKHRNRFKRDELRFPIPRID